MLRNFYKSVSVAGMAVILATCQIGSPIEQSEPVPQSTEPLQTNTPSPKISEPITTSEASNFEQPEQQLPVTSVWQRIRLGLKLTDHYIHPDVERQLATYRNNQRFFDLVAERASPFLFGIAEEIESRNLPMELALLPMIESTFNPNAYSSERAVGLWQFLGATGSEFGLQQDWWYDGRRDPENSTRAALDYLEQLHAQFEEDWLLALAAYNTGGANLNRALRRNGQESPSFWDLRLATETRTHIPKLLALSRIIVSPEDYGVTLPDIPNHNPLAEVDVGTQIDLALVAELIELPVGELKSLNPGYLQWATHPQAPQTIAVPLELKESLEQGLTDLDPSQFVTWEHYRIRQGDTLGAIARKLSTTVDVLQVVNQLSGTQIIAGRSLLIPRGTGASDYTNLTAPATNEGPAAVPPQYTVRSGDNLWSIARRFDLRSREIAEYNSLSLNALLHPGQVLDLSYSANAREVAGSSIALSENESSNVYRVRRGDSMQKIAARVGANLEDLLRWNGLSRRDLIFPGQLIKITATEL